MNGPILVLRELQRDRVGRYVAEAEAARRAGRRPSERRIRRALGRSMLRLGERLVSEPAEARTPVRTG